MHYDFLCNSGWMLLALSGLCANTKTVWFLFSAKIEPPKISSVKPVLGLKQMVQIKWTQPVLAPKSSTLNYTLRFRAVNSTHWVSYAIIMFLRELLTFVAWNHFFHFLHLRETIVNTFLPSFLFGPFRLEKCFTICIFIFAFHSVLCLATLVLESL